MPACSQCDKDATSQCEGCSRAFCGKECQIKSQCCIGAPTWPRDVRLKWIEQGLITDKEYDHIDWNSVMSQDLTRLMKTAPKEFYAFMFSSNPSTITVLFGGGKFERLKVILGTRGEYVQEPSIWSETRQKGWRNLEQVSDYYSTQGMENEVQIGRPGF